MQKWVGGKRGVGKLLAFTGELLGFTGTVLGFTEVLLGVTHVFVVTLGYIFICFELSWLMIHAG